MAASRRPLRAQAEPLLVRVPLKAVLEVVEPTGEGNIRLVSQTRRQAQSKEPRLAATVEQQRPPPERNSELPLEVRYCRPKLKVPGSSGVVSVVKILLPSRS